MKTQKQAPTREEIRASLIAWSHGDFSQNPPSAYSETNLLTDAVIFELGTYDCADADAKSRAVVAINDFCESADVLEYCECYLCKECRRDDDEPCEP